MNDDLADDVADDVAGDVADLADGVGLPACTASRSIGANILWVALSMCEMPSPRVAGSPPPSWWMVVSSSAAAAGRDLNSSTVQLNVSTFCGIRWVVSPRCGDENGSG